MDEPRAWTKEEVRDRFLHMLAGQVRFWATCKGPESVSDRLEGLAFSFLNLLDGTAGFPAVDLIAGPHETDKAFHEAEGENYFPPAPEYPEGTVVFNDDVYMHDLWYQGYAPFTRVPKTERDNG